MHPKIARRSHRNVSSGVPRLEIGYQGSRGHIEGYKRLAGPRYNNLSAFVVALEFKCNCLERNSVDQHLILLLPLQENPPASYIKPLSVSNFVCAAHSHIRIFASSHPRILASSHLRITSAVLSYASVMLPPVDCWF